tara:strand:- start:232 stop:675 length:444 start_codon:yes stop_codon:yes gene_type:complete
MDINSAIVAVNAPIKITFKLISKSRIRETKRHITKHAKEPDKVLFPIFIKGNLIPTKAATVSPNAKKNRASKQNGLGTKTIVINAPANTHVDPVKLPCFSKLLIINDKYFSKILEINEFWFLDISIKKQKITIADKNIIISILFVKI